jgi:ribosomal protein RSM22 (predicted rRNA methylase)
LDPDVEKLFDAGLKPKKQPGKRKFNPVMLPTYLEIGAKKAISRHLTTQFRADVHKFTNRFHHIQLPDEPEDVVRRQRDATEKVIANEKPVDWNSLTEDERAFILEKRKKKISDTISGMSTNWTNISYDDYKAHVYAAARLAPNYACLKYVFNDIMLTDPTFKPKTLFDFGSGTGTTMFAANEVWPNSISEHFNVDISSSMNDLSSLLLRGGEEQNPMIYNGVYHREYLPLSSTIKYDLVVSAFSLLELPSRSARIQTMESLWQKTHDLLVIIEHGSKPAFAALNEVRSLVLDMTGHDVTNTFYESSDSKQIKEYDWKDAPTSHILAPCPHHMSCPKMFSGGPVLCNFNVNYHPLDLGFKESSHIQSERFSYVVLRKGRESVKKPKWPRINQEVIKKHGHAVCRMCCPDGGHKSITFSKGKHKGHLFRLAKVSEWGDLLPAVVTDVERRVTFWDKVKRQQRQEKASRAHQDDEHQ